MCGAAVIVAVAVVVVLIGVNVAVTVDLLICCVGNLTTWLACEAVLCRTITDVELVFTDRFDVDESVDDCWCSAGGDA